MIKKLTQHVIVRFVVSGGTAAFVDLVLLYVLNSVFHLHYIFAAIVAFIGAFGVSFTLHKRWTFKTDSPTKMERQVLLYLATSLVGLFLNTFLMYIFVSGFHIFVIGSQVIVGLLVACVSYFLSRNIVFKYKKIS